MWQILIRTVETPRGGWRWAPLGTAPPITRGRALWFDAKVIREPKIVGTRNSWHVYVSLSLARFAETSELKLLRERDPKLWALLEASLPNVLRRVAS